MGWRGAGGGGAATIGTYYFFGGLLQLVGSVLEFFIGNTFPFVVFGAYGSDAPQTDVCSNDADPRCLGAFWLSFAITLTPAYNAEAAFTASAKTPAETAAGVASFESSLGNSAPTDFQDSH